VVTSVRWCNEWFLSFGGSVALDREISVLAWSVDCGSLRLLSKLSSSLYGGVSGSGSCSEG
jgi:hypothetical protein